MNVDNQDAVTPSETPKKAVEDWSRPAFEPGNLAKVTSGARSPRVIAERAEHVHAELLTYAPYLDEDRFIPAVRRYLHAASREALLDDHIREVCDEKGAGAVSSRTWEQVSAAARLAAKLGSDLGLDPIGHAKIRALSASAGASEQSLGDLAAAGARVRAARAAASIDATAEEESS
jgi:hypothetical protein